MVRYTSNLAQVTNRIDSSTSLFLRLIMDRVYERASPKTPRKSGRLRGRVLRQLIGASAARMTWDTPPYAAVQEEKQFKNYTTPGTGSKYALNAINDTVNKDAEKIARKAGMIL